MLDKLLNQDNINANSVLTPYRSDPEWSNYITALFIKYYDSCALEAHQRFCNHPLPFDIKKHDRRDEIWTSITGEDPSISLDIKRASRSSKCFSLITLLLENFFRWGATRGFGACGELKDFKNFGKEQYTKAAQAAYEVWKVAANSFTDAGNPEIKEESLLLPEFPGNIFGWCCEPKPNSSMRRVLPLQMFRHSINAMQIIDLLGETSESANNIIVEIGGGWGILPQQLYQVHSYSGKMVLFDLPEINVVSEYFLKRTFPEKSIQVVRDPTLIMDIIEKTDIIIVPAAFALQPKNFPIDWATLVFNSHSLVEMNDYEVSSYLNLITHITKPGGLFFQKNHTEFFNLDKIIEENLNWTHLGTQRESLDGATAQDTSGKYNESLWGVK